MVVGSQGPGAGSGFQDGNLANDPRGGPAFKAAVDSGSPQTTPIPQSPFSAPPPLRDSELTPHPRTHPPRAALDTALVADSPLRLRTLASLR